jgi:hypothetical protein
LRTSSGVTNRDPAPPTPEETEHANRQPGAKGHPHERGPTPESGDEQPEESLKPEHRRQPSGLLDEASHRPGQRDRPERNP